MADRPILRAGLEGARDKFLEQHPRIAKAIGRQLETTSAADPSNSLEQEDVPEVAAQAAAAVAPILQNAQNDEPWYRSRVKIGTIIAAIALIAKWFGFELPTLSAADMEIATNIIGTFGVGVAGLGRWLKNRPPIVWHRPWTILGIGT